MMLERHRGRQIITYPPNVLIPCIQLAQVTQHSSLLIIGLKSPWRNIRSSKQSGMVAGTVTSEQQQVRFSAGGVQAGREQHGGGEDVEEVAAVIVVVDRGRWLCGFTEGQGTWS